MQRIPPHKHGSPYKNTAGAIILRDRLRNLRYRSALALLRGLSAGSFSLLVILALPTVRAQETVFDVPSADILDKGKVYGELDYTARYQGPLASFTPRVVVGIGHNVEIGANFNGLAVPTDGELTIAPTMKWRPWKSADAGWSFYVGDDIFFPVRERTYNVGNYVYAAIAKEWKHGTRVTVGAYDFTRNVIATGNRAGGQFTLEQSLGNRWTVAAEWYTGKTDTGFVNTGLIVKLTSKLSLYAAYQIGNSGITQGNHQFLGELGYNFY